MQRVKKFYRDSLRDSISPPPPLPIIPALTQKFASVKTLTNCERSIHTGRSLRAFRPGSQSGASSGKSIVIGARAENPSVVEYCRETSVDRVCVLPAQVRWGVFAW